MYVALVALGANSSSLGVASLRHEPSADPPGVILGTPRDIRSDDFLRSTPWTIGLLHGTGEPRYSPLTHAGGGFVSPGTGGWQGRLAYPDAVIVDALSAVSPTHAFSLGVWFPMVLTLIAAPLWFQLMGVPGRIGIPSAMLIAFAPMTAWWSWAPAGITGWTFLAAVGTLAAVRAWVLDRRVLALLLVLAGGLGFGRVALGYQPWALPLAIAVLFPTLAALLSVPGRRLRGALATAGVVTFGGVLATAFLRQEARSIEVLFETVYPGGRRSTGELLDLAHLFGAPHLWVLQKGSAVLSGTNQSELSSGYLVLGALAFVLVPAISWRAAIPGRAATITAGISLAVLATWCTVAWPDGASKLFPFSFIPAPRMGQVLGVAAIITFGLLLERWAATEASSRIPVAVAGATFTGFITAMAGSVLRTSFLPTYRTTSIALVTIIAAVVVFIPLMWPRRWWMLVPMVLAIGPVVVVVNPIQRGFGDLRGSEAASTIRSLGAELDPGDAWAADDYYMDSLLMANSQLALSGQQWVGPNRDSWEVLDPSGEHEELWNRGASFIRFDWIDDGSGPEIAVPQADVIDIVVDPCHASVQALGLRLVSSDQPLRAPCLIERAELDFGNARRIIYEVDPSAPSTERRRDAP
jgi:hypothetical protein